MLSNPGASGSIIYDGRTKINGGLRECLRKAYDFFRAGPTWKNPAAVGSAPWNRFRRPGRVPGPSNPRAPIRFSAGPLQNLPGRGRREEGRNPLRFQGPRPRNAPLPRRTGAAPEGRRPPCRADQGKIGATKQPVNGPRAKWRGARGFRVSKLSIGTARLFRRSSTCGLERRLFRGPPPRGLSRPSGAIRSAETPPGKGGPHRVWPGAFSRAGRPSVLARDVTFSRA